MKLGRHQLDLLAGLGAPKMALVVGDKVAQSLASRGGGRMMTALLSAKGGET
jgi:hypothetical protein